MLGPCRFNGHDVTIGREGPPHAGEQVAGVGHHHGHQCFQVFAGSLEFRGCHQLHPPSGEDPDGIHGLP